MNKLKEIAAKNRNRLLSPVLLVIFILCLGTAHWLVKLHAAPVTRAQEILNAIRSEGLGRYFAEPEITYMITTDHKGKSTWSIQKTSFEDDRFHLIGVFTYDKSSWGTEEITATGDLSTLSYKSQLVPSDSSIQTKTSIYLANNEINVTRNLVLQTPKGVKELQGLKGKSNIPSNYIPEGMIDLVVKMVNRRGKPASFKIIIDSAALDKGFYGVNFIPINLKPLENNQVEKTSPILKNFRTIYTLDNEHKIKSIETNTTKTVKASLPQLLKKFPHQQPFIQKMISSISKPKKESATQPADTENKTQA